MDLSFSGAGFMGCYYFGVVNCWNKYIPRDRVNRVAGASAGSLIAAYYLMDLPLKTCLRKIIELTEDVRRRPMGVFDRSNQIVDVLPKVLDELFPEDAHKRVGNRLYICMTRLKDMKKIIVNEFETRQDLIDALNCSCFIPVWSGNHVSTYKGVKHIDGGFSDNLPIFDEHTIRICCFSGETDISPYDRAKKELLSATVLNTPIYFTLSNFKRGRRALFPPPASYIVDLLERGFHDTKDFILTNDLIQCDSCYRRTHLKDQPIYAKISPTITPSISPTGSQINLSSVGKGAEQLFVPSPELRARSAIGSSSDRSSFRSMLREKLQRVSSKAKKEKGESASPAIVISSENPQTAGAEASDMNNNPPVIVVQEENGRISPLESEQRQSRAINDKENESNLPSRKSSDSKASVELSISSASSEEDAPRKRAKPSTSPDKNPADWRSTSQLGPNQLLADKFKLAANPLPSCPPSPNLNRTCIECTRLRQEARMDLIDEDIRCEAEKYRTAVVYKDGGIKNKLSRPIRWLRQLGVKNSYRFEDTIAANEMATDPVRN